MSDTCKHAQIIEVIKVVTTEGSGKSADDPIKEVSLYWSKDGELLFKTAN